MSQILSDYNIENKGIRINDKTGFDFSAIDAPFIAQVSNDFAVVHKITANKIHYLWRGIKIDASYEEFKKIWSGILLIVEANKESIEPNYLKKS